MASPDHLVREFVQHWGAMARAWGINPTMGEIFALLYITGSDWTADDLRAWLSISRGNVSMNLRELIHWGVVQKVHHPGRRREFFRAETDVWTLFRRILIARKRRELEPTLTVLEGTVARMAEEPALAAFRERAVSLERFFRRIDTLATRLVALDSDALDDLLALFEALDGRDSADAAEQPSGRPGSPA